MDWSVLVPALLGSGGFAGIAVAIQNWFGAARASRRIQVLTALRGELAGIDERAVEALELAIQVATFQLASRVAIAPNVRSIYLLILLFAGGYASSPLFLDMSADQSAAAAFLRILTGVSAAGGGYASIAIGVRVDRARQVKRWMSGEPIRLNRD